MLPKNVAKQMILEHVASFACPQWQQNKLPYSILILSFVGASLDPKPN